MRRYYPERVVEDKSESVKKRIERALTEIKEAARNLPLQAALNVGSAVMDIEAALEEKPSS